MSKTMLASKSKSGLAEASTSTTSTTHKHTIHATSKVAKLIRGGSTKSTNDPPASHRTSGISDEKAMSMSMDSKLGNSTGERRSIRIQPRLSTPSERASRPLKLSELQEQVTTAQEELKKAREKLSEIEKEKTEVLEDLSGAKKMVEEVNDKLEEAINAKRRAEEAWEIEKFRAIELEQASIESAQKKEDEWKKKLEITQKQHSQDIAALVLTTKELEKVRAELGKTVDARYAALNRAEEIAKTAEENEKKVAVLNEEVNRLNGLLKIELENKTKEASEIIKKLEEEAMDLKVEVEKGRKAEEKLVKMEELVEGLKIDVAYAKRAEVDSAQLIDELKKKAEELENKVEELDECKKMKENSLISMTKQLEESNSLLRDKISEICALTDKVQFLEPELAKYRSEVEKSGFRVDVAQKEVMDLRTKIENLEYKVQELEEEKREAVNKERMASLKIESLSEERVRMLKEQESMKDELDNSKKAMGDLASALREVSSEAREAKERVLAKQAELEGIHSHIAELNATGHDSKQKYELKLEQANYEIACLKKTIEKLEAEGKSSKEEWHSKEVELVNSSKKSEQQISTIKSEMDKVLQSLKVTERELVVAREDKGLLHSKSEQQISTIRSEMDRVLQSLKVTERELVVAREDKGLLHSKLRQVEALLKESNSTAEIAKSESMQLREILSDKETKFNNVIHEINELRARETMALAKIEELTASLAQAKAKKFEEDDAARNAENSKVMLIKLEMDKVVESLRNAEREIQTTKDDKAQLQNKLKQVESKITETNLNAEEAKIESLRLKEMLSDKDTELKSIAKENDNLRHKEAAASSKIEELSSLLVETMSKKVEENSMNRSVEKPNMLLKLICSPLEKVREEEAEKEKEDRSKLEAALAPPAIRTREVHEENRNQEQKSEKEKALEESKLENGNGLDIHLMREREKEKDHDTDYSGDEIEVDSNPDENDQTNGLLAADNVHHHHKKKKALLKKFGNLLKKKVTTSR
ncbi:hypothetical protein LUZ60_014272 [Juncus effusus]|nr:hypothetical protein LUZ60_014272 [Juncus effusus]